MENQESAARLLLRTDQNEASIFQPENLLREARRQRSLADAPIPDICLLDPEIVLALVPAGRVWGIDRLIIKHVPGLRRWQF